MSYNVEFYLVGMPSYSNTMHVIMTLIRRYIIQPSSIVQTEDYRVFIIKTIKIRLFLGPYLVS